MGLEGDGPGVGFYLHAYWSVTLASDFDTGPSVSSTEKENKRTHVKVPRVYGDVIKSDAMSWIKL